MPTGRPSGDSGRFVRTRHASGPHSPDNPDSDGPFRDIDLVPLATDSYLKPPCSIDQIRTFLAVASREHVTDAAKALRLSQPAVTQQIQQLERALELRLFQRVGRNIKLTEEGLQVAAACLLVMRSLENLEQVARSVRGLERGSLMIGATQVTGNYYLSGTLATFAARHPDISLDVVTANTEEVCMHVASGQLDCGLVDAPLPDLNLQHTAVAKDEVVLVAHPDHPLLDAAGMRRGDLRGAKYLVWEPGSATDMIAAELLGAGYEDVSRLLMTSLEAVRRALLDGLGFASVPRIAVDAELHSGALARLPVPSRPRAICAVRRPTPAGSAVEAFWPALAGLTPGGPNARPHRAGSTPERSTG